MAAAALYRPPALLSLVASLFVALNLLVFQIALDGHKQLVSVQLTGALE